MSSNTSTFILKRASFSVAGSQSVVLDLERFNVDGFFSLHGIGDAGDIPHVGKIDVSYKVSNDGVNFVTPTGATNILDDVGDNDNKFASFSPPQCRSIEFTFTADDEIEADFFISMS
jgi:hypothetical protein